MGNYKIILQYLFLHIDIHYIIRYYYCRHFTNLIIDEVGSLCKLPSIIMCFRKGRFVVIN